MTTIDDAIKVLNRLHEVDPSVMQKLVYIRVLCNEGVALDPTIQVVDVDGQPMVGILGIINGLFGVDKDDHGFICADVSDGIILGFSKRQDL